MAPREADTPVRAARAAFQRASLTVRSLGGRRLRRGRYIHRNRGPLISRMPATEAKDSCRLTLAAAKGFWTSRTSRASPRAEGASSSRRAMGAKSRADCMMTARTADGVPPAMRA